MKFKVKNSGIDGKGCYAEFLIKKGESICIMEGDEIGIEEVKELYDLGKERVGDPLQIDRKRYIDLKKPFVYFNHSCMPNASIIGKNELIAIKEIKKGEEIFFDYSLTLNDEDWGEDYVDWDMECSCASKNCRGLIEPFYKLDDKIKMFYIKNGWVQDFVLSENNQV
jgi:uncharacterized protein